MNEAKKSHLATVAVKAAQKFDRWTGDVPRVAGSIRSGCIN